MSLKLTTPEVLEVSEYSITSINNDVRAGTVAISYSRFLSDGSFKDSNVFRIYGKNAIKSLYGELTTEIQNGLTFEEASRKVLYAKLGDGVISKSTNPLLNEISVHDIEEPYIPQDNDDI